MNCMGKTVFEITGGCSLRDSRNPQGLEGLRADGAATPRDKTNTLN
jgi:hypothetical protein